MGLLVGNTTVGNTTVIEHCGTTVSYSRTVCENYQSERAEITFIVPKGVSMSDGFALARAIVNTQLGEKVRRYKTMNRLCLEVFEEPLSNFSPDDD